MKVSRAMLCAVALATPLVAIGESTSSAENAAWCTTDGRVVDECLVHLDAFDAETDLPKRAALLSKAREALLRPVRPEEDEQAPEEVSTTIDYCSHPDQALELADFVRKNLGRFRSEIPRFPDVLTVLAKSEDHVVGLWRFDDSRGEAEAFSFLIDSAVIVQTCKAVGSFEGVSAMGVKRRIQRRDCTRLEINDEHSKLAMPDRIAMSPARYREIKARGYKLAIAFAVGDGVKGEVVEQIQWHEKATIQHPVETATLRFVVHGTIKQVCLLAKDGTRLADARRRRY